MGQGWGWVWKLAPKGAAWGQRLGLVAENWELWFSQQLAGKGCSKEGNKRKGKDQTSWMSLLNLLANSVECAPWQLDGVNQLRKVHQEARDGNECKPSYSDLELWLKPGGLFCSPYPSHTLLRPVRCWSLYELQILGSDVPWGGRFLQKTASARPSLGASPGESEHRGKGRFQTINRFFFFLMSDLLASGKWQKVLLKRLLYGIVVLLGVAERSL